MNKLCVGLMLVLLLSCAAHAQNAFEASESAASAPVAVAAVAVEQPQFSTLAFAGTSARATNKDFLSPFTFVRTPAASVFLTAASSTPAGEPSPAAAPAPRFVFGGRDDFRWQLGLGISLVRFRSRFFYATGVGTDTSLTYFTNDWFGLEGRVTTSFAPTINLNEHVKFVGYGGGPKVAWRTRKFEPFVHTLVGGMHILPRTAGGSPNGLELQIGGGAGYRFNPRLSARIVVDWMRTRVFGEWEDNAQAVLQAVLHF